MSKFEELSKNPRQGRDKDLVKIVGKEEENIHFASGILALVSITSSSDEACIAS